MWNRLRDFLIPHEGNSYAPHALQKVAGFGMLGLVFLSFALANLHSLIWVSSQWMVSTVLPGVIVDLTNDKRSEGDLGLLRRNPVLDAAATMKAQHMAQNQYFAHYSPDGVSPWYWFDKAQYPFVYAGENLAIHFTDSDEVVEEWMNSPTHRANIMKGEFTEIGVGAVEGYYKGFKTVYVVQLFGTPAIASAITAEPVLEPSLVITVPPEQLAIASDQNDLTDNSLAPGTPTTTLETLVVDPEALEQIEVTLIDSQETDGVEEERISEPVIVEDIVKDDANDRQEQVDGVGTTTIAETIISDNSVVLYSDLISTSTNAVPAIISGSGENIETTPTVIALATKPQQVLQVIYILLGLFILLTLILSIFIEIRYQQPLQIAYSFGLLFIMGGLFYVHIALTGGAVIV